MSTNASGKVPITPAFGFSSKPSPRHLLPREQIKKIRRYSPKGLSLAPPLKSIPHTFTTDSGQETKPVSFGASVDELRSASKVLVPSSNPAPRDFLIEKIQIRLKELIVLTEDGKQIKVDGIFSPEMGTAIADLRNSLNELGFVPGDHIDGELMEYLFPANKISNVENRKIQVSEKTSTLGEFPSLIEEVQHLLNKHIRDARLPEHGLWSQDLSNVILKFQNNNFITAHGRIDAATLKLLRGASHKDLIACGDAVLVPGKAEGATSINFVRVLQQFLNKHLKRELTLNGIFCDKTASILEIAQKAAGIIERKVFSKESYDELSAILKNQKRRNEFSKKLVKITLASELLNNLGNKTKANSLCHKVNFFSTNANNPEQGILDKLDELGINIESTYGISAFQRARGLIEDGRLNRKTAEHLYELISIDWCKKQIIEKGYVWREAVYALNAIGLRGWSPETGSNNNASNEWNDTICFIWKDSNGRLRYKEYTATTDPGFVETINKSSKTDSEGQMPCMEQGQYKYCLGYYYGKAGAAVPLPEKPELAPKSAFEVLWKRFRSLILGSHPFAIHWAQVSRGLNNKEKVGQLSLGAQVPKITKSQFLKEITPLFKLNEGEFFYYTLLDLSS